MNDASPSAPTQTRLERSIDKEITGGLAVIGSGGATNIVPRNLTEIMEFAKLMATSGPCVRPAFRGNPGACLGITMQSMRWGFDPFAVANKAYITTSKGGDQQIAYEAQLIHAVVNERAPLSKRLRPVYEGQGQGRKCKIIGWLKGEVEPLEYESPTIGSITVQNSPLRKTDPDQQLIYYAIRAWARRHVPEILLGAYTPEEVEAQEHFYGPEGAKDISPARPERDAEPAGPTFEVTDFEGVISAYSKPTEAYEHILRELNSGADQRGQKGLDAAWENNSVTVGSLREAGHADLAEALHEHFAERSKQLAPKKPAEQKPAAETAQPKAEAARPKPADQPAPKHKAPLDTPFNYVGKERAKAWPIFTGRLVEELAALPSLKEQQALLETYRGEWGKICEDRPDDMDRINAVLRQA